AAIQRREAQPGGWQELLDLAELCRTYKQQHGAAARFYAEAFAANPKAEGRFRYAAASSAVRAGAGQGKDADKLDDKQRADLRRKALGWLRDEVKGGTQSVRDKDPASAALLPEKLKHWQNDPALFSVRDARELAKLPDEEKQSWRKLWSDVDQLLEQANAAFTETNRKGTLTVKDRERVHEVKMSAGNTYVIDMTSNDFDTYLRLETASQKIPAENDDIVPDNLNSPIIFPPKEDGLYRIIATSYQQRGAGEYTITIREFQRRKE